MANFFDFNIGQIFTVTGGVVSLIIVWQKMRDKVDELGHRLSKNEQDMGELTKIGLLTTVAQHERRLIEIEGIVKRMGVIETDVGWIKSRMERMDRDGR